MSASVPNLPSSMEQTVTLLDTFAAVARRNLSSGHASNLPRNANTSSLVRIALSNSPSQYQHIAVCGWGGGVEVVGECECLSLQWGGNLVIHRGYWSMCLVFPYQLSLGMHKLFFVCFVFVGGGGEDLQTCEPNLHLAVALCSCILLGLTSESNKT